MDPLTTNVFNYEIGLQCRFILRSAEQLDQVLGDWEEREAALANVDLWQFHEHRRFDAYVAVMCLTDEFVTGVWFALQGVLVAAANISKLLWGSGGASAEDRTELRSRLGVSDGSPLQSPRLRNHFEHIDEWISNGTEPGTPYVGRLISHEPPGSAPLVPNEPTSKRFGHFDPVTQEVTFWHLSVSVPRVVQEAERLLATLLPPSDIRRAESGGQ